MLKQYFSITLLLFALLRTAKSEIAINDITSHEASMELTDLAVYMARRFVSSKTNTLVIIEKCAVACNMERKSHTALLTNILSSLNEEFAIQLFFGHGNDRLWDYNIFIVDSSEAFIDLRYNFPITQHERFFNFFILLTWGANSESERQETLSKIFETSLSFSVRNVVVLNKSFDGNHFIFYTYELFKKGNCQDAITIREINRYENGTLQNEFLFPNHINDFNGCYLNVSAELIEPLLTFDGDVHNGTHLTESHRLSGVEGDILKVVAEALNFKIRLRFPHGNTAATQCLKDLEENRANIAIGAFTTTLQNGGKFSSSYMYHTTPFVFVLRSGLCFGPIKQLLNPFCPMTWTLLLIIFSISFIFTKVIQTKPKLSELIFGPKNTKPISSMFVIFFGNALPSRMLPKKSFARFLLASWLLLSLEVRNGYQGKMFDSLRFSMRVPIPKKITQLLEQDYTLLSSYYKDYYPRNKTKIIPRTTHRELLNTLQTTTLQLTATALLDSLAHYNYFNKNNSTLTYVDEAINMMQCVMYFRKHSIFRFSIDRILKVFDSAGITSGIAKKHVYSCFKDMNMHSRFEIKLANSNLTGLYFISSIMGLISVLVFVFELLSPKWSKLRKIMDGLNSF